MEVQVGVVEEVDGRKLQSSQQHSTGSKQASTFRLAVGGSGTTFTDTRARERGQRRAKKRLRHTEHTERGPDSRLGPAGRQLL